MKTFALAALLGAAAISLPSAQAASIDWASIPGKDVTLFYPGQTSWEYILTPTSHSGAPVFRDGKNCFECHNGEEALLGGRMVSGAKNEPNPIAGKPAAVVAKVKFAHDATNLYVHLDIKEGSQPDAKMDPKFATKVTMMLSDGKVAEASHAGCWGACHEDLVTMPNAGGAEDRRMYLVRTRAKMTRQGGGDELKPADALAKMKDGGETLEYWQARVNAGAAPVAIDGSIFERRVENATPVVTAEASQAGDVLSVTLSRKLKAGAPYKDIVAGTTYTVGFAIHAGHTARRFHYVSMERSFVLDQGTADFIAAGK